MNAALVWKYALRELRSGLGGFRVLLLCLILGVAAIAGVTSLRDSIGLGLSREGAVLLGGDAQLQFTYRFADANELSWITENSARHSAIADFRSMLVAQDQRALTQVKAVDDAYPLTGSVVLEPAIALPEAFAAKDGVPGIVLDTLLVDQLGLKLGDLVSIGDVSFEYRATLVNEPDAAGSGFALGPRSLINAQALAASSLLAPGTLFDTSYRMVFDGPVDLQTLQETAQAALPSSGFQWQDSRNGAPGIRRFVERLGSFLVLVGLAGLAIGGVGVSAAVRAYLEQKTSVLATLKTLGASQRFIFSVYFLQIGLIALGAIAVGLVLGAILPSLLKALLEDQLPVPLATGLHVQPLLEAAIYGVLSAAIFVLWPLAKAERIKPVALYRGAALGLSNWPRWPYLIAVAALSAMLVFVTVVFSDNTGLVLWTLLALALSFVALLGAGRLVVWVSKYVSGRGFLKDRITMRIALAALGGQPAAVGSVVLSLGLGLTVLSAIGQIDSNLRGAIGNELPERAPSFFVVDIQPGQIDTVLDAFEENETVTQFETAPMLRGLITKINGAEASDIAGDHWVIQGDRGITYAAEQPENYEIVAGNWWPQDYAGPPQISFAAEEAEEMGLKLGDTITLNVLGRDIIGQVTSLRDVDFSSAGMGFILAMNEAALKGAPHSHIATVYMDEEGEAALVRQLSKAFPNITMIRVRDAIERAGAIMKSIASASTLGAMVTLVIGLVVMFGSAATEQKRQSYEVAILKTLGATRQKIFQVITMRAIIVGFFAGLVALVAGSLASWAVIDLVMQADFDLSLAQATKVIALGVAMNLCANLFFLRKVLRVRPAQVLRQSIT